MNACAVEHVEAELFHSFTESGYSRPARLTCSRIDGSKVDVYVKFMGGIRNREFGLGAELVSSLLARELELSTPTPFIVNVSAEFHAGVPKAAQDLINRSLGLNFGSESAPPGFSVVPPHPRVPLGLRPAAAEVFAFDIIVQNYDRKTDNPNLLWDRTKIVMIDHEGALSPLLSNTAPSFGALELDRFYDHVFYSAVSPGDAEYGRFTEALGRISTSRLDKILGAVPVP
jgi:HipA-like kinase